MSKRTAAALVLACVLVAGCSGPFAEDDTTERATTELATNSERVIAASPPNGTTTGSEATPTPTDASETQRATTTDSATAATMAASGTATTRPAPPETAGNGPGDASETGRRERAGTENATAAADATTRTPAGTFDRDVGYEVRVSNGGATPRNVTIRVVALNDSAVAFAETVRLPPNGLREFDVVFPHAGTYEARVRVGNASATRRWAVASRDPDDALSVHVSPEGRVYVGFVDV